MNERLWPYVFDLMTAMATTLPIVIAVFVAIRQLMRMYIEGQERSRYDDEKHEAILSELRASYEHRIADLAREMVATRARWEDANHLLVTGQRNQPAIDSKSAVDVDVFLKPYGIRAHEIESDPNKIFVLTPFAPEERAVFDAIADVCSDVGFNVARGDEYRAEGDILPQIIEGIVAARIVIANISSRNPNVFFELGIAMALGKPTLLLSDTLSEVPFDLQSRRIIVFKDLMDLRGKLTTALLQTVRSSTT